MSDRRRVGFRAHGEVQGVFFRDTVREAAEREGVAGWVRNEDDGTVRGELEGPEERVEAVLEVARAGSKQAAVERVDVEEAAPEGAEGFEVR